MIEWRKFTDMKYIVTSRGEPLHWGPGYLSYGAKATVYDSLAEAHGAVSQSIEFAVKHGYTEVWGIFNYGYTIETRQGVETLAER